MSLTLDQRLDNALKEWEASFSSERKAEELPPTKEEINNLKEMLKKHKVPWAIRVGILYYMKHLNKTWEREYV